MDEPNSFDVPDPPSGWEEQKPWQDDSSANAESRKFDKLDVIEKQKEENKKKIHAVLGWCLPITVFIAFSLFWGGIIIYGVHLVTPWGWMSPEQQKELHTLLFSSALGAVVIQGARRYLD